MYKKLSLLFLFVFLASAVNAASIELGYYQTKSSHIKTLSFSNSVKERNLEMSYFADWRDVSEGYRYSVGLNSEYEINSILDCFLFGSYENDTLAKISDRIDIGIGAGYYLSKKKNSKQKISYALLIRDNVFLNSFRYKYKYDSTFLDAKLTLDLVTPKSELKSNAEISFKLFKYAALGIKNEYIKNNNGENYMTYASIKMNL